MNVVAGVVQVKGAMILCSGWKVTRCMLGETRLGSMQWVEGDLVYARRRVMGSCQVKVSRGSDNLGLPPGFHGLPSAAKGFHGPLII